MRVGRHIFSSRRVKWIILGKQFEPVKCSKDFLFIVFCLIFVSVFGDESLDNAFEELESSRLFGCVYFPVFEVLALLHKQGRI
jgi:hypothetical protein